MVENEPETAPTKEQKPKTTDKSGSKRLVLILMVIVLTLASASIAFWWRDKEAKKQQKQLQTQIDQLKQQLDNTQKQLDDAKTADDKTETPPSATVPTQALIDNIKAVFASGNSAALEGYMASPTNVIIAASEGIGNQTPLEATKDVDNFMKTATDPWNFSLPAATLTTWRNGFYKQYFPANAVVGKSDNMVISFSFNSSNKINTVFMTNNVDVLTQ